MGIALSSKPITTMEEPIVKNEEDKPDTIEGISEQVVAEANNDSTPAVKTEEVADQPTGEANPGSEEIEADEKEDRTIEAGENAKDDCSDLTDNNEDTEEQAPKSFPQKVSNS
jgi:hypothetical protein